MRFIPTRKIWMHTAALLSIFFAGISAMCPAQTTAAATTPPAVTPYSLMQLATITSSTNTINATRVPVVNAEGQTNYFDVNLLFDTDSAGNLALAPGYPTFTQSRWPVVAGFKAGTYVGPSNVLGGKSIITVSGPGTNADSSTLWTITVGAGGDKCTYPASASWYVGPLSGSPLAPRLKSAAITSTDYSYGTIGGQECYANWNNNVLVGLKQVGNTLTIYSFTYTAFNHFSDQNTPVDQITYQLVQ